MTDCVVILVTCPDRRHAMRLAKTLVRRRVAACVNLIPRLESVFRWQGKVEQAREVLLIIKTTARRFEALRRAVCSLHSYEVPEVIALPVSRGHSPYLRWVVGSVRAAKRASRS